MVSVVAYAAGVALAAKAVQTDDVTHAVVVSSTVVVSHLAKAIGDTAMIALGARASMNSIGRLQARSASHPGKLLLQLAFVAANDVRVVDVNAVFEDCSSVALLVRLMLLVQLMLLM